MPQAFWITLCTISVLIILMLCRRLQLQSRRMPSGTVKPLVRTVEEAGLPQNHFVHIGKKPTNPPSNPVAFAEAWRAKWHGP